MKTEVTDQMFKAKVTTLKKIDLFPASEKALGDAAEDLCSKMRLVSKRLQRWVSTSCTER
jgi:hypothetical protein